MLRAIHFGAGNIGRGFIGLVLNQSGYQVDFVDINDTVINALKLKKTYQVELVGEQQQVLTITDVNGYHSQKEQTEITQLISEADLVTTAVGVSILPMISKSILPGLRLRIQNNNTNPLNLIACENAIGGSDVLKQALYEQLTDEEKMFCEQYIGFPNSAVDRIVPNQVNEDPLYVKVEPFFEWVIEESTIKGDLHHLEGVHLAEELQPYIERKLFTVNTGHATCAYTAYQNNYEFIHEAILDTKIHEMVLRVLEETGKMLTVKYHFDSNQHRQYIEKTMSRFKNPKIIDEVTRVARSPKRKVSQGDRFVRPLLTSQTLGLEVSYLPQIIAYAFAYDHHEDPEANEIQTYIDQNGIEESIVHFTGIESSNPVFDRIVETYRHLTSRKAVE